MEPSFSDFSEALTGPGASGRQRGTQRTPAELRISGAANRGGPAERRGGSEEAGPIQVLPSTQPRGNRLERPAYRYGNFPRYYGYRVGQTLEDPRLAVLREDWCASRGCRSGPCANLLAIGTSGGKNTRMNRSQVRREAGAGHWDERRPHTALRRCKVPHRLLRRNRHRQRPRPQGTFAFLSPPRAAYSTNCVSWHVQKHKTPSPPPPPRRRSSTGGSSTPPRPQPRTLLGCSRATLCLPTRRRWPGPSLLSATCRSGTQKRGPARAARVLTPRPFSPSAL